MPFSQHFFSFMPNKLEYLLQLSLTFGSFTTTFLQAIFTTLYLFRPSKLECSFQLSLVLQQPSQRPISQCSFQLSLTFGSDTTTFSDVIFTILYLFRPNKLECSFQLSLVLQQPSQRPISMCSFQSSLTFNCYTTTFSDVIFTILY